MRRAALFAISVCLWASVVTMFRNESHAVTETYEAPQKFDAKAFYKPNCEECHGSAADKRFNPDNPESQLIDSILNGAQAEGSKDMPAFSQKGIDEARAKVLIAYMKSIRE
jgi:mono/diheme cytochrome c family protein